MRSLKAAAAVALTAAALPAGASAAGFDGTYQGTSTEGQGITVVIKKGEATSIGGAAVQTLHCTRDDPTQPFPNDRQQLPDRVGSFAVQPVRRSSLANSQFLFGTPSENQNIEGDHVENSAEGRFNTDDAGKPIITMTLFYKEVSNSGSQGQRDECSGGSDATLKRTSAAPAGGRVVNLHRPRNLPGKVKATVPSLASIGEDGIDIAVKSSSKALGGTVRVSVERDKSKPDRLRFGNGELGSGSGKVKGKHARASFNVDMKGPVKTPKSSDEVPMIVTVTFDPKRGKTRHATTQITVSG